MWSGKCGRGAKLCPFSFGLALGITAALAVIVWVAWAMFYGLPLEMASRFPEMSWTAGLIHAFWAFVKGFIGGFVFALLYDVISCCCKAMCCKKPEGSSGSCACGCSGCQCGSGPSSPGK